MKKILFIAALVLSTSIFASANTLTLEEVTTFHQYPQTMSSPCVIGDPSCATGALPAKTVLPSPSSSYDAFSPVYTVADIRSAVGNDFIVGIDINQSSVTQTLSLFTMLIDGAEVDIYSDTSGTLVPPTVGGGNGNGYADYLLTGLTSLAGYDAASTVQFHVTMPTVDDGREQFFLLSTSTQIEPVPEPATLVLVGGGLIGIVLLRRRLG